MALILSDTPNVRHSVRSMLTAVCIAALAAGCSTPTAERPFDVGNMAYPEALPEGNLSTTRVAGRPADTGNMAYPQPVPQGVVGRDLAPQRFFDTGSMSYGPRLPIGEGPVTSAR